MSERLNVSRMDEWANQSAPRSKEGAPTDPLARRRRAMEHLYWRVAKVMGAFLDDAKVWRRRGPPRSPAQDSGRLLACALLLKSERLALETAGERP